MLHEETRKIRLEMNQNNTEENDKKQRTEKKRIFAYQKIQKVLELNSKIIILGYRPALKNNWNALINILTKTIGSVRSPKKI